ncbi:division abnormally delayed protein [Vespula maculifrons]|uniref:Division abnormally delayed protein n=1 Tax=Vespula maculifrons TaxID=7453 RepID=A0ABD2AL65_VESMC
MKIITVRRQNAGCASPASLILFLLLGILFGGCVDAVLSRLPRSLDRSKNETDCEQVAAFFENENNVVARLITTRPESGTTSPISKNRKTSNLGFSGLACSSAVIILRFYMHSNTT